MCHSYVYIVRCADGSLYTGVTSDVQRAMCDLNGGRGSTYTRARLPVFLAYTEEYMNDKDAEKRASSVKRMARGDKEQLLVGTNSMPFQELGYAS